MLQVLIWTEKADFDIQKGLRKMEVFPKVVLNVLTYSGESLTNWVKPKGLYVKFMSDSPEFKHRLYVKFVSDSPEFTHR